MSDFVQAKYFTKGVLVEIPNLLVKEDGSLLNTGYYINRFNTQVFTGECIVKTRPRNSRTSYLEFSHKGSKYLLHRVLASTFKRLKEGCNEVRHLDDDILNNSLDNLEWGTREENAEDASINGKIPKGRNHPRSFIVQGHDESGNLVYEFCSKTEIQENGFWQANIHKACDTGNRYKNIFWRKLCLPLNKETSTPLKRKLLMKIEKDML